MKTQGSWQRLHTQARQHWQRAAAQRLRLAVTGLSGSGKTVFLSSLIHHLLHSDQPGALPFFTPARQGRIQAVRVCPDPPAGLALFPWRENLQGLTQQPPLWPRSTSSLSGVTLEIRYRPRQALKRLLGESAILYLELIDYPGEWLLDLPLLEMDYLSWCQFTAQRFVQPDLQTLTQNWQVALSEVDWLAPTHPETLQRFAHRYQQLLQQLQQAPHSFSLLQPGRFLLPGEQKEAKDLTFFPIWPLPLMPQARKKIPAGSYLETLQTAYRHYAEQQIRPFYQTTLAKVDRQIILVDLLKTLNQGQHCFQDMQTALSELLRSFQYGRNGILRRLFSPKIDKVLLAATKADHVTTNQQANLQVFLNLMLQESSREIRFNGVTTQSLSLASVRATRPALAEVDGQQLSCLTGRRLSDGQEIAIFPGEIPTHLPQAQDWHSGRFRFIDFAPEAIQPHQSDTGDHLRLDQALEALLGDRL